MRRSIIIVMVVLSFALTVIPAYAADTGNKRAENNKNIAEFILDTIKLPYVLIGAFVKQDYEKAKEEVGYKEHKGLERCLNK